MYHQLHCSCCIVVVLLEREKGVDLVAPLKKVPWSSHILKKIFVSRMADESLKFETNVALLL